MHGGELSPLPHSDGWPPKRGWGGGTTPNLHLIRLKGKASKCEQFIPNVSASQSSNRSIYVRMFLKEPVKRFRFCVVFIKWKNFCLYFIVMISFAFVDSGSKIRDIVFFPYKMTLFYFWIILHQNWRKMLSCFVNQIAGLFISCLTVHV